MSDEAVQDRVFKALGDARRRRILDLLREEPLTTGRLCDAFPDLDRCTVMQHLRVLEDADLVLVRRQGRYRWNYLNPLPIKEIHDRWINRYAAGAVDLLARLKKDLESEEPRAAAPTVSK
ncbi:MAG TPA: helix-turn-helix transcriptional regulator [Actinomycetota bacterium]|nr:helix-turn-helix transcriptional regulator [Actinomycetota bacterium]